MPDASVARWDLSRPRQRLRQSYSGLDERLLARIETAYRHFLYLRLKYPQARLVPHRAVDEMWHQHILHTRDYAAMCLNVLGGFFHHEPSSGGSAKAQDYTDYAYTRVLLRHHFGSAKDPEEWLKDALAALEGPA